MTGFVRGLLILVGVTASFASVAAQEAPPARSATLESQLASAAQQADVSAGNPATLTYANRPILQFRASVLGRPPTERALAARQVIDRILSGHANAEVVARAIGDAVMISIGGQDVFGIVPADVNTLAGDTLESTAARAVSQLQSAVDEVAEAHRPRQMLTSVLLVLLVTALFAGVVWLLRRGRQAVASRVADAAKRRLQGSKIAVDELVRASRIVEFLQQSVGIVAWTLILFVTYSWLTFSLRRFPYTRYWGESLREFLLDRLSLVGTAILDALPGLFTVLIIVLLTRFVSRFVQLFFRAIAEGRISVGWIYPETAEPTRKLVVLALWLGAVAISYPFLPGSDSEAFKGMSVLVGLMVSLGSSGLVSQMMGGFTLTYSRALRRGDFVSVGDIEGTVTHLGTLSTKILTPKNEDVTIPNAVVVGQTVTNHSRGGDEGVFVTTDITIGYDVAWRQVEAMMLLAAARTPGVRRDVPPKVRPSALQDAYVKYTLFFCLEEPKTRRAVLAAVHANILDAFNEYGVQITSPNYEADPATPKIVPREQWYPPASLSEAIRQFKK